MYILANQQACQKIKNNNEKQFQNSKAKTLLTHSVTNWW